MSALFAKQEIVVIFRFPSGLIVQFQPGTDAGPSFGGLSQQGFATACVALCKSHSHKAIVFDCLFFFLTPGIAIYRKRESHTTAGGIAGAGDGAAGDAPGKEIEGSAAIGNG